MQTTDVDRASLFIATHVTRELLNGSTVDPAELAIDLLTDWEGRNAPCGITDEQIADAANLGIKNAQFLTRMRRARS